jgi:hypothetical protein
VEAGQICVVRRITGHLVSLAAVSHGTMITPHWFTSQIQS